MLELSLGACLAADATQIVDVVGLELGRAVALAPAPAEPGSDSVVVECEGAKVRLRYDTGPVPRVRELDLSGVSSKARARTVALAVAELLDGPDLASPHEVAVVPTPHRDAPPRARSRERPEVALVGTGRIFPRTADISAGARLRSTVPLRDKLRFLIGAGGEQGTASRSAGRIAVTDAFGELGVSRALIGIRVLTLDAQASVQGGFVSMSGKPASDAATQGHRLTAGWTELTLGVAPAVRLSPRVGLTSRAAVGWIVLGPAATRDAQSLNVWRGVSIAIDLGLSVAL